MIDLRRRSVVRYRVAAPPERVVDAIARAMSPGGLVGVSLTDRTPTLFVGRIANDSSFDLRRPRGLTTAPRIAVLRGRVEPTLGGAIVNVWYALHPLAWSARVFWLLLLGAVALVVLPASFGQPELLWILVIFAFVIVLMLAPFEWLARVDRAQLRSDFEETLRHAGPISSVPAATGDISPI